MSYRRSAEDKRRNKKNRNQLAKSRVAEERVMQGPRRKDWTVVSKPMADWAKNNNVVVKRKGGMYHIPADDYYFVYSFYDIER